MTGEELTAGERFECSLSSIRRAGTAPVAIREVAEADSPLLQNEALVAVHAFSLNRGETRLFQVRPKGFSARARTSPGS